MDIIVTIPKNTDWEVYKKEIDKCLDGSEVMNFSVPHFPKNTKIGENCYLVYRGMVVGYMKIVGFSDTGFVCSTTGTNWGGKFIQRSGAFVEIEPYPMKGFQGWRYYKK